MALGCELEAQVSRASVVPCWAATLHVQSDTLMGP